MPCPTEVWINLRAGPLEGRGPIKRMRLGWNESDTVRRVEGEDMTRMRIKRYGLLMESGKGKESIR